MAISKQRKAEMLAQYKNWFEQSRAVILVEYTGLTVKDLEGLRRKLRETGGEFRIIKNTLGKLVVQQVGYPLDEEMFVGSTAIGFAFEDPPGFAKALTELQNASEFVKIKGGYLASRPMSSAQIKALAELPPLPVVRAQLLGALNAPASKLARLLAEPGRQIASVIQAYAEKDAVPSTA